MSDTKARELGITPLARIVASGVTGLNPEIMGLGPVDAIRQTLARAGMTIDDIDLVEINEAFAAQVVPSAKELGISYDKLNVKGGAIALGHPFGQTGARIMTTLLNALEDTGKTIGLESMCVGGGQGMAMIVERPSGVREPESPAITSAACGGTDRSRAFDGGAGWSRPVTGRADRGLPGRREGRPRAGQDRQLLEAGTRALTDGGASSGREHPGRTTWRRRTMWTEELDRAGSAGATLARQAAATPWGGYSVNSIDLDRPPWEVSRPTPGGRPPPTVRIRLGSVFAGQDAA